MSRRRSLFRNRSGASVIPIDKLVSYYKLDDLSSPIVDSYGNNDGVNYGFTLGEQGKINQAVKANTGDTSIEFNVPYLSEDPSFSVSGWIYISNTPASRTGICRISPENTGGFHVFLQTNRSLLIGRWNGSALATQALALNQWHYMAVTYDAISKEISAYINGEFDTSVTINSNFSLTSSFSLGINWGGAIDFDGLHDEFSIYNEALNESEIVQLYNNGNGIIL